MARGKHVTLDAIAARSKWPDDEALEKLLVTAAIAGNATPLECRVIPLPCARSRPDSPPGGTAWVGLDESHITLHYYFEGGQVLFAMDAFTCGEKANPFTIVEMFEKAVDAQQVGVRRMNQRFLT